MPRISVALGDVTYDELRVQAAARRVSMSVFAGVLIEMGLLSSGQASGDPPVASALEHSEAAGSGRAESSSEEPSGRVALTESPQPASEGIVSQLVAPPPACRARKGEFCKVHGVIH